MSSQNHRPLLTYELRPPIVPTPRQILSKDQWEELRPIIRRLYFEEGKTFKRVAAFLRDNHGFAPTKRQFDTRTAAWGFRKNVTQKERYAVLKSGGNSLGSHGKVVKAETLKRWEKEFSKVLDIGENAETSTSFCDHRMQQPELEVPEELNLPRVEPSDPWPWSTVDIPGSPQLSRLFKALTIEANSNIEPLSLSSLIPSSSQPSMPDLISNSDLIQLSKKTRGSPDEINEYYQVSSPSPFNEVYPFPSLTIESGAGLINLPLSSVDVHSLTSKMDRLHNYLATFGTIFPPHNPMILESMEELADAFSEVKDFARAEIWWKKVVALREQTEGFTTLRTLKAMVQLFKSIEWTKGKHEEVESLAKNLRSLLTQTLPEGDELAIEFLSHRSRKLAIAFRDQEAEETRREILQLRLNTLGPRHGATIQAISTLGEYICRSIQGGFANNSPKPAEFVRHPRTNSSVNLIRAAVQLLNENTNATWGFQERILIPRRLVMILQNLGNYSEASKLIHVVLERCTEVLGEKHPATLQTSAQLATIYRLQRKYEKAIPLLKRVVELQDEINPAEDIIRRAGEIAQSLTCQHNYQEATGWWERVLSSSIEKWGLEDEETIDSMKDLGDIYILAQKSDKAVAHYSLHIARIHADGDDSDHRACIEKLEGWKNDVARLSTLSEEQILQSSRVMGLDN